MPTTYLERQFSKPPISHSLLPIMLAIGCYFAYVNWFYLDDAYIAFRYARHFAEGHGFVWYPGSQEYGYTNFLFTILVGLLMKLGLSAEHASAMISIPSYIGILALTYHMGGRWLNSKAAGTISCFALATHLTMNGYATSGLETSLQAFLILLSYHFAFAVIDKRSGKKVVFLLGLSSMLALLTRLDSAVLIFPAYLVLAIALLRDLRARRASFSDAGKLWLSVTSLPLLGLAALFAFCYSYYGQILPNSFYVKVDGNWQFENGLRFLISYLFYQELTLVFIVLLALGLWASKRFAINYQPYRFALFAAIMLWFVYLLYVGGDFMQFRFMVPLLPLMTLYLSSLIMGYARDDNRDFYAIFLLLLLGYGNYVQRDYFTPQRRVDAAGVESFPLMAGHVMARDVSWSHVGRSLRLHFYTGSPADVKVALSSVGAAGYFSGLPMLDLLGLNSRGVIDHSVPHMVDKPGHRLKARLDYVISQNVNLLIGHPNFLHHDNGQYHCLPVNAVMLHHPIDHPLVLLPLENDYFLPAFYLKQHERVDALLKLGVILRWEELKDRVNCEHIFPPEKYKGQTL